jgi:hypothetical protein
MLPIPATTVFRSFDDPNNPVNTSGASAILTLTNNFNAPHGVFISQASGAIWVTDTNSTNDQCSGSPCAYAAKRYGRYPDQLLVSSGSTAQIPAAAPALAVAEDPNGDLLVADFSNRIALYFHGLRAVNGASFLFTQQEERLAPGMLAALCAADATLVPGSAALD